jgi:hypothetical protein
MELSDEQKRRIREEEQARLAEEQYRAQVRREFQTAGGNVGPMSAPVETPKEQPGRGCGIWLIVILLIGVGVAALVWISHVSSGVKSEPFDPTSKFFVIKHNEKITPEQVVVKAGSIAYYTVPIKEMHNPRITGHFLALGGSGNDIRIILADEKEFGKIMNGLEAKVLYVSDKTTSGNIDVILPSYNMTYYLCFDNRFSILSEKIVNTDIVLSYSTSILW